MQDHHRELIRREAEAWLGEGTRLNRSRGYRMIPMDSTGTFVDETEDSGILVVLQETDGEGFNHCRTEVYFTGKVMPLTAQMVKERFANPFGGKG